MSMDERLLAAVERNAYTAGDLLRVHQPAPSDTEGESADRDGMLAAAGVRRLQRYTIDTDNPARLRRLAAGEPGTPDEATGGEEESGDEGLPAALVVRAEDGRWASHVPWPAQIDQAAYVLRPRESVDMDAFLYYLALYNCPLMTWYRAQRWGDGTSAPYPVQPAQLPALPVKCPDTQQRTVHTGKHVVSGLQYAYETAMEGDAAREDGEAAYGGPQAMTFARRVLWAAENVVQREAYGLDEEEMDYVSEWMADYVDDDVPGIPPGTGD